MNTAYISLGSNMGDRAGYLEKAINILGSHGKIEVTKQSSLYETDPVGFTEQDEFLNMVIEIRTSLSPETLLHQCLQVEIDLGREREFKWGPRIIDLDILLFNRDTVETENLLIPHPRMQERAFVLIPLLEVAPRIEHPSFNAPFAEFLDEIPDKEGVRLWKQINGEDAFVHSES
ncbi:2-amino-4-hydroxy-6-hydroxymethyldihydropteridine diphosphokinase [Rossellomorea vietnamensis]|uniref:2-amino-4-hydroxy-6-hydroxymethyldihydropteridine diphosphokinase n=1 Tax=Rossellomorea vietnamensis TaxID=218284 RepID=A0A0P6WKK7_9BACI|nr:2-amino-4-hydroxy-6-hydroxymethyldihydropteridine diphosphokinase [Rossellomorea vietnamensis]KPL58049.1 2-amino-4-hydroxy-6-hydroxymethyldihydropteridine pyrophosphokinase [Rossellomorea vietnamensis]